MAVVVVLAILGATLYHRQSKELLNNTDKNLKDQVKDLYFMVHLQIMERQSQINSAINSASEILSNSGNLSINTNGLLTVSAINQIDKSTTEISLPKFEVNGTEVYNDNVLVDKISEITNVKTTLFQKMEHGYLRIATTVLNLDGSRAVNTFIPNDSPVVKAIENGSDYFGRAYVVNDWYLTAYRPIKIDGNLVGMLFVGMPEKDMKTLGEILKSKKFFDSGYTFLISNEGEYLIHPQQEGKTESSEEILGILSKSGAEEGQVEYIENSIDYRLYYKYIPEIKAYISAIVPYSEIIQGAKKLRIGFAVSILLCIIVILVITTFISNNISNALDKGISFAKEISEGNLKATLDLDQKR
ncbi:MAG: hypothetical protein HC830_10645 [Bacteroidetes bacterium]|nr:hypothetical protein [Bacteroidota bacterium]